MMTKYFISSISAFMQNSQSAESIKKALRDEAFSVLFRLLVGMILTSTIIYSVIQVGEALQTWLNQFENELVFKIVSFSLIAIVSAVILYFLFHSRRKISSSQNENQLNKNPSQLLQNLALQFLEGFVQGYESTKHQDKQVQVPD